MADQENARRQQPRIFRNQPDFLNILTEREIKTKYMLNKQQIEDLHHQIEGDISTQTEKSCGSLYDKV